MSLVLVHHYYFTLQKKEFYARWNKCSSKICLTIFVIQNPTNIPYPFFLFHATTIGTSLEHCNIKYKQYLYKPHFHFFLKIDHSKESLPPVLFERWNSESSEGHHKHACCYGKDCHCAYIRPQHDLTWSPTYWEAPKKSNRGRMRWEEKTSSSANTNTVLHRRLKLEKKCTNVI